MRNRTLHPGLQQLAALVLTGTALGVVIATLLSPVIEAIDARAFAADRLALLEQRIATPFMSPRYQMDQLVGVQTDGSAAQITLQTALDRIARNAGIQSESTRPLDEEPLGQTGAMTWIEVSGGGDLLAVTDLLRAIDNERPVLLVRNLEIDRGPDARGDGALRVRIEVGLAWTSEGSPS